MLFDVVVFEQISVSLCLDSVQKTFKMKQKHFFKFFEQNQITASGLFLPNFPFSARHT